MNLNNRLPPEWIKSRSAYLFFKILILLLELHYVTSHLSKFGLLLQTAFLGALSVLHESIIEK